MYYLQCMTTADQHKTFNVHQQFRITKYPTSMCFAMYKFSVFLCHQHNDQKDFVLLLHIYFAFFLYMLLGCGVYHILTHTFLYIYIAFNVDHLKCYNFVFVVRELMESLVFMQVLMKSILFNVLLRWPFLWLLSNQVLKDIF